MLRVSRGIAIRLLYVMAILSPCGPSIAIAGETEPNGGAPPSPVRPSFGTLVDQAEVLAKANKLAEAQIVYESALRAAEQVQGPQSSEVAHVLYWQANFYKGQQKYDEASSAAERALNICNQVFGRYHVKTAQIYSLLGSIAVLQRQSPRAEQHFSAALEAFDNRLGSEALAAYAALELGKLLRDESRFSDAETAMKRAVALREKASPPNEPALRQALSYLGDLYQALGRYSEAGVLFMRAIAIQEKIAPADELGLAPYWVVLGTNYRMQSRFAEAEPLLRRALSIREALLQPSDPAIGESLYSLGALYRWQGRYIEAEPFFGAHSQFAKQHSDPRDATLLLTCRA
jgi:tetratricopeptide (TPR) repeat protein